MVLIRSFMPNGHISPSTPMDLNQVDGVHVASDSKEITLKSLSKVIQNTLHAFGWQYHMTPHPEKVFFSEIGTMDLNTADQLNRLLDIPAERISIRGDKRVRMDDHLSRIWDPALMDRALALTLRENRKGRGFNFRKGEFEVTKRYTGLKKEIRKISFMLGLVLLFIIIDLAVDYQLLKGQYKAADQQVSQLYSQAFPNEKNIIRPLDQIKIKVNQIRSSAVSFPGIEANQKVVDLLKDISNRLPSSLDILITNMIIDQTTVRMSGETDSFNTVDSIKNNLEPSEYFNNIDISSAKMDRAQKRVQFEIKLERASE
jgi:general secretion pathway protein L